MKHNLTLFFIFFLLTGCVNQTETNEPLRSEKSKADIIFSEFYPKNQHKFNLYADFNSGILSSKWRKETTINNRFHIDTISNIGRFSDGFLVTEMNPTGEGGVAKRSEYGINLFDKAGQIKYLSYSFKIDGNLSFQNENFGREIMISQWHSKPAPNKDWKHYRKFNEFNRPSIALYNYN